MTTNLRHAIKLREWTRRAIDEYDRDGDHRPMCDLNQKADRALAKLDGDEMREYMAWLDRIDPLWRMKFDHLIGRTRPKRRKR